MVKQHDGITFVSEADFDADPKRWIDAAGPDNEVAVYDENDEVVMMMGGTYVIPDDSGRAERQVAAVREVLAEIERRWRVAESRPGNIDEARTYGACAVMLDAALEAE